MKTQDLFTFNRSSKRLNESIDKVFGKKINFETFDTVKLEDARNKLRTQIHSARSESGFNETIENEALTQAQWMHDAIVAELMHRQEHIVDSTNEGFGSLEEKVEEILEKFEDDAKEVGAYGNVDLDAIVSLIAQGDYQGAADEVYGSYTDKDGDEPRGLEPYIDDLQVEFEALGDSDSEPDDSMDGDHDSAMASAGFGSDEDYGYYGNDEAIQYEDRVDEKSVSKAQQRAMGAALAAKRGDIPMSDLKGASKEMAKMSKSDLRDFAKTKHKGLPEKVKKESVESGEDMTTLKEGEVQQASAIVTAKTMVDRVSRWIEELSGMENDTLLQLGDSIRDEMGQEQAKSFISAVAPAIQQALENLKTTRETLSTGVRSLTGEEQPAEMLGGEPGSEDEMGTAEPDMMNAGGDMEAPEEGGEDEFAAAEPAAGGLGDAGREQRESINRSNSLLKVLAG